MRHCRFRTWSPRLAITTAVIVTGVVGAPIARADNGAEPGVPSQDAVAAAVADAATVPASMLSASPVPAVPPASGSLPPVGQAAVAALQPVDPNEGTPPVVPSQPEQPALVSDTARPAPPPPANPADSRTEAAPSPESAVPGAQTGDSVVVPDAPGGATISAGGSSGDITSPAPTTREQPEAAGPPAASQLGPVNIQVSIRVASPGDNGAVTQVNAVITTAPGSTAPVLDDRTAHADTIGSPGGSGDIGRDITGTAVRSGSDDSTQDSSCDPDSGCCEVSLLAGVCLDTGTDMLLSQDLARILGTLFQNTSSNADVTAQYQGDAVQYRPINISISIRISSPGDDGPVVQANLVQLQASIAVAVGQADQALPVPPDPTVGLASAEGDVAWQDPGDGESERMADASAPADIEARRTSMLAPTPLETPFPLSPGPVSRSLNAISRLAWGVGRPPSIAWIAPIGASGTAGDDAAQAAAADRTAQRGPSRAAAPSIPPAHPWFPVAFSAAPASAPSGGGGGGGLAIALSLPFVLALLISGFGRFRTSVSVPSAHVDREPERPG
jgi:hypothetical protein